jgi:hypothetical protein
VAEENEIRSPQLAAKVEEIERLIRSGVKTGAFSLAALLESAQARLAEETLLETKETVEKKEREQKDRQGAIAQMVERETKLNEEEKERYGSFLQKEYFTKSDFNELDHFYSHSYDKLSNEGKAEMHTRIEEGIRRGEFRREELPTSVRTRDDDSKKVEAQTGVQAGRATKISEAAANSTTPTGRDVGDSSDQKNQVASRRDATESNPEKLKQAAVKARAAVPSDSLQGLELAFDDSSEPAKPSAANSSAGSKGHSI